MKTALLTSFLIVGLAGSMFGKTADLSSLEPVNQGWAKLVADLPTPSPKSKKCPLRADLPTPNPRSKKCPLRADLPTPNPRSKKCPLRIA
jgi:hypothetical protein